MSRVHLASECHDLPSASNDLPNGGRDLPSRYGNLPSRHGDFPIGRHDLPNRSDNLPSPHRNLPGQRAKLPSWRSDSCDHQRSAGTPAHFSWTKLCFHLRPDGPGKDSPGRREPLATAGLGKDGASLPRCQCGTTVVSPFQGLGRIGDEPRASLVPHFALGYHVATRWASKANKT